MRDDPSPNRPSNDDLHRQHHACMAIPEALQRCVASRGDGDPTWRRAADALIAELCLALVQHFADEVRSELFVDLPRARPWDAARLARLAAEHPVILAGFADLRRELADLADASAESRWIARLRAAIATLRRHEAEETEIMLIAGWDDLGGSG